MTSEEGYLTGQWRELLKSDAPFDVAAEEFVAASWNSTSLEPKLRELLYVALTSATTTLFEPGMRAHMRRALDLGASAAEIMEVLELVSVIGIHSCAIGVPMLVEELPSDDPVVAGPLSATQEQIKTDFIRARHYWSPLWDGVLRLDPEFFRAYLGYSAVPWLSGALLPKYKELVYVAVNASATHLYVPGLRQHMRNAVSLGATRDEVAATLRLSTALGMHSVIVGLAILNEELGTPAAAEEVI